MTDTSLLDVLASFARARVVVVGDVMLDRFVYGSVARVSPEAPIPVLEVTRSVDSAGGAANVARNVAAIGAGVTLVGVTGNDMWAADLRAQIATSPAIDARLIVDFERPTTVKTRYVADGQQMLRADRELRTALSADVERRILAQFEDSLRHADVVVLSDYAKGVLSDGVTRARHSGRP